MWTSPASRATGDLITAAIWNAEHVGDLAWLAPPDAGATSQGVGNYLLWDSLLAGVTFPTTGIWTPTLPTSFKHLLVLYQLGQTADNNYIALSRNGGSPTNSWWGQSIYASGGSLAYPSQGALNGQMVIGYNSPSGVTVGEAAGGFIFLPDYTSGASCGQAAIAAHTGRYYVGGFVQHILGVFGGMDVSLAATTSLGFTKSGTSWAEGRISVYGLN